jgi:hypothetical protein
MRGFGSVSVPAKLFVGKLSKPTSPRERERAKGEDEET